MLAELALLPTEERQAVEDSIEEFMTCLGRQFEGTVQPEAAMQRLAALIYGHPAPQAVEAMERYAGALNDLLVLSRNRLISAGGPRDH